MTAGRPCMRRWRLILIGPWLNRCWTGVRTSTPRTGTVIRRVMWSRAIRFRLFLSHPSSSTACARAKSPRQCQCPRQSQPPSPKLRIRVWVRDGLTDVEAGALGHRQAMESEHPHIAQAVLGFRWLADGITEDEQMALGYINRIIGKLQRCPQCFPNLDRDLARARWLTDDITGEERAYLNLVSTEVPDLGTIHAALGAGP